MIGSGLEGVSDDDIVDGSVADGTVRQGIYVDATFGRGGHTARLLARLGAQSRVVIVDRDLSAVAAAREMAATEPRLTVCHGRFSELTSLLNDIGITRVQHGVGATRYLPREFFDTNEYRQIMALSAKLSNLLDDGAYVQRGERTANVSTFAETVDWLMAEARRGQSIQRYKGLGEMNPDQLWDTTVNPETRRLMQVKIEDAVKADEIFTTLMGDQVEPRREFIEKNALMVANLDI